MVVRVELAAKDCNETTSTKKTGKGKHNTLLIIT